MDQVNGHAASYVYDPPLCSDCGGCGFHGNGPVATPCHCSKEPEVEEVGSRESRALAEVLSPSQASNFTGCSLRWWYKYGLGLPDPANGTLALGKAVHAALGENFRQKIETKQDLSTTGVVARFRNAWADQMSGDEPAVLRPDEEMDQLGLMGERLVAVYMDEAAPAIEPAAVELHVSGTIAGVKVQGYIDVLDVDGRIIDIKTASKSPSGISFDQRLQISTYRQLAPGASGAARIDTLVKTKAVKYVPQSFDVSAADLLATERIFPLVQEGMRAGLYTPNRSHMFCSRRHCSFWRQCEREMGGEVAA